MMRDTFTEGIRGRVRDFIRMNGLIQNGGRILLSLSAGKDSIAMLNILSRISGDIGFALGIFHLNHMTRGIDSDREEDFLKSQADSYGYPFFGVRHDFSGRMKKKSFEEHARDVRYAYLNEISERHGYPGIATAHTLDDHAETILMRIFSGTGIRGLAGIPVKSRNIIRPLLCLTSGEVYEYLRASGMTWHEDRSNRDTRHLRNYIRHEIIPVIRKRFPAYREGINRLSANAAEFTRFLEGIADDRLPGARKDESGAWHIDLNISYRDHSLIKLLIGKVLRENFGISLDRSEYDEIIKNLERDKSNITLFRNSAVNIVKRLRGSSRVIISRNAQEEAPPQEWQYELQAGSEGRVCHLKEAGITVHVQTAGPEHFKKNVPSSKIFVSFDGCDTILFRNRRRGDRIELEFGSKKIKELFIEKKLDNQLKNSVPLLIINREIAAVMPGLLSEHPNRVSARYKVSEKSKKILVISGIDK